jgi:hypothetical protein
MEALIVGSTLFGKPSKIWIKRYAPKGVVSSPVMVIL